MTSTEIQANVKKQIKEAGYSLRQVSVRKDGGLDTALEITIRCAKVDRNVIDRIAKGNEDIDKCEASGEVLCGGNTYCFVRVMQEVLNEWGGQYVDAIKAATEEADTLEGNQLATVEVEGVEAYVGARPWGQYDLYINGTRAIQFQGAYPLRAAVIIHQNVAA